MTCKYENLAITHLHRGWDYGIYAPFVCKCKGDANYGHVSVELNSKMLAPASYTLSKIQGNEEIFTVEVQQLLIESLLAENDNT